MLTDTQIDRYSRQIILPEVGGHGQTALLSACLALWGEGELAAVAALHLAAAGVGHLRLSGCTASEVAGVNPDCRVSPLPPPRGDHAAAVVDACNVVLCAGAPAETCLSLNHACVGRRTPLIWGDAQGATGALTVFAVPGTDAPCAACHASLPGPVAPDGSTLATCAAGFIGALVATEAIKLIVGIGATYNGRVLRYDARDIAPRETSIARNAHCAVCGDGGETGTR